MSRRRGKKGTVGVGGGDGDKGMSLNLNNLK